MDKKLLYESPTIDVFTVQTEGVVCQSINGNSIDQGIADTDWGLLS